MEPPTFKLPDITIGVVAASSTAWSNPTIVYVDGVRTTNLAVNHHYDVDLSGTRDGRA